jgi:hypothetical protein
MARRFAALMLVATMGSASGAQGQGSPTGSLTGNGRPDYAPIVLHVACGEVFDAPCAKVLPRIAARTARAGLELQPVESGLALDTAAAVCQGQVAAAIVPRDVIALLGNQPACKGRYDVVDRPLYPYYAFLVVRADGPYRRLDDLARERRPRVIAAGTPGSGGQVTMALLRQANPALQRAISLTNDDAETALARIAEGSLDAFFSVEALGGVLIDRIRTRTDAAGKPLYAFIDVNPGADFWRDGDGGGHCLYRLAALDFGGPAPVTTVSVDAVMVLGRAFRDVHARGGPSAPDALGAAIDASHAAILADMKSRPDWRPAATLCQ